jgi:hypothetical protein
MFMPETFKSAVNHFISKKMRRVKLDNFGGKRLPNEKMLCPPGNCFVKVDEPGGFPGDGSFAGMFGGYQMQIDTPRKIKAAFDRGIDLGVKFDDGHYK